MRRTFLVCTLLLGLPPVSGAAPPNLPAIVVRMTVQPKAAPEPALKYQLLPELREMNPGNPIHEYTRCFAEQHNFWRTKEATAKREKWQTMPLSDLPVKEIRQSYGYTQGRGPLSFADAAARMETPDWQTLARLKRDGVGTLLPDVQGLRELASALKVRFRVEIAERHFEDAIVTAKTMLALSRHFNEHPTLIGDLVGVAIATLALSTLDEMIEHPGCPNLFWALTDLPSPFIDLRKGLQGERIWIEAEMPGLNDGEPMSDAQLKKIVDRLQKLFDNPNDPKGAVRKWMEERTKDKEHVRAARKRLVEALSPADVAKFDSFPPLQIVLLDAKLNYDVVRDEVTKALALPYWQAHRVLDNIPPIPADKQTPLTKLVAQYDKVKRAQARLDQRIALLRCVEALRMYAAEHDGKLPAKLDEIRLPLPVDPATGKPFAYKVDGKTAYLHGEPLAVEVRYEVTIGKPLTSHQLDACWTALANEDAAKAYDAVWALVAVPEQAVTFLQKHLPPVPRSDAITVARLLADLDSDDFMVRQKATEELSKLGDSIAPALRGALEGKPSLEMRRRVQQLLDQSRGTAERLRARRAVRALEHIGTRPAREILQALAAGASGSQRTEEAKAALQRMAQ